MTVEITFTPLAPYILYGAVALGVTALLLLWVTPVFFLIFTKLKGREKK
jgi:hypothetical protein